MSASLNGGDWPRSWAENRTITVGQPGGAPVLLLSGLNVSAFVFRPVLERCSTRPFRAVAQSLAGHTGDFEELSTTSTKRMLDEARETLRSMAACGRKVILGGFSAGSLVAALLARECPELVEALLLVGFSPRLKNLKKQAFVLGTAVAATFPPARPVLARFSVSSPSSSSGEMDTELQQLQPRFPRCPLTTLAAFAGLQNRLRGRLKEVVCPIHFFHGQHDDRTSITLIRKLARELGERSARRATLVEFAGSPHSVPLGPEADLFADSFVATLALYL